MARITVEDCEEVVKNRFDLVVLAAQRTRQILAGDKITVEDKDEKKPVIALREIAARTVSTEDLKESVIKNFRTFSSEEDLLEDIEDVSEEEDTYNPYIGVEMKALESDNSVPVVDETELEAEESVGEEVSSEESES
ncbi:MAG: DNA-directed RNA polymerase subunit omega [Alphaproteobacteria bacterium]|nr:DNA-directed RNA polymerase subunit omega [Alphaproteobacteria bacterium]